MTTTGTDGRVRGGGGVDSRFRGNDGVGMAGMTGWRRVFIRLTEWDRYGGMG